MSTDQPLPPPGPLGRIARLASGALCGVAVWQLWIVAPAFLAAERIWIPGLLLFALPAIYVFSHVVNIGFRKDWGRLPLRAALLLIGLTSLVGFVMGDGLWNPVMGTTLLLLLGYTYTHLGVAFLLSALLQTPGCEMRSPYHLAALARGQDPTSVVCPGALGRLDDWEEKRRPS